MPPTSTAASAPARPRRPAAPPSYRGASFLAPLRRFQHDPLALLDELTRQHGDVVQLWLGPLRATFLRHPEHVEHVLVHNARGYCKRTRGYRMLRKVLGRGLVTSEGDFWRRQRRIAQPAFEHARIASFADAITGAAERMLDERWAPAARAGEPLDVSAEMMRITLDVVSETMLGIESGARADAVAWAVPIVLEHVMHRTTHALSLPEIVPTRRSRRYREAIGALDEIVRGIVSERRQSGAGARVDLLDMLMSARDADSGEHMSDEQLRDEVMTVYTAGHETTAVALGWTLYLLSQHPEWDERVRAELTRVLGGRPARADDLGALDVTRRVLQESLRLYPPVWLLARKALADDVLGGYRIPKGRLVFISPWLTHRHPEFWPDAERFDPDRFLPERKHERPHVAYLPFSAGQRKCIGDHFAMLEAQLILAAVLSRFRLSLVEGHAVTPFPAITLRQRHGIRVRLSAT